MGVEIERKFLVDRELWQKPEYVINIRQGYLSIDKERTVRVRVKGKHGYITIKGMNNGISRLEMEYEIPLDDANKLLDELCIRPIIEKNRYIQQVGNHTWEIDEFYGDNHGLLVAEIELAAENETFEIPEWIIDEVSGDSRYYNSSLIKKPYTKW